MPKDRNLARILGLATALIWGLSFISIKTAVGEIPPMTLGLARFVVAVAILPLIALGMKQKLAVSWSDLPLLFLGGMVGYTLYFLGENNGVKLLTSSEASILIGTIPVLTMLAERIFLRTRLPARAYFGAALSLAGVVLIVARTGEASRGIAGWLFMGLAAVCWVGYAFLTRAVSRMQGQVTIAFWQSLFGLIGFIPFAIAESGQWRMPSPIAWLNIAYLGVFCSALGYWFYITSLDILGPGGASVFINLIPVISVIAGFAVLGDRLTAGQWVGALVAIAGVWLATTPARRSRGPAIAA
jgi:drug/metabolite transporter (DMT)-like permease